MRRIYEQGIFERPDELMRLTAEDVAYVNPPDAIEPGTRRGRGAVGRAFGNILTFDHVHHEIVDLFDGGDTVVAVVSMRARMRGSEAEIRQEEAHTWTFRDGLIAQFEWGRDVKAALAAAGHRP